METGRKCVPAGGTSVDDPTWGRQLNMVVRRKPRAVLTAADVPGLLFDPRPDLQRVAGTTPVAGFPAN